MSNKKIINIVKGDINAAIDAGTYVRDVNNYANIEFDTKDKQILLDGVQYTKPFMLEVTWSELKNIRDNNNLIPGMKYRITDYQCTTSKTGTSSGNNQFDIIITALNNNTLSEQCQAIKHTPKVYNVTFNDDVIKQCYIYKYKNLEDEDVCNIVDIDTLLGATASIENDEIYINESSKTASTEEYSSQQLTTSNLKYEYFQDCNLSAWQLWYCLDNDTSKFDWANTSTVGGTEEFVRVKIYTGGPYNYTRSPQNDTGSLFAWKRSGAFIYSNVAQPQEGDTVLNASGNAVANYTFSKGTNNEPVWNPAVPGNPKGRGVIYKMIDDFDNECSFDFKNIKFESYYIFSIGDAYSSDYDFVILPDDDSTIPSHVNNTILVSRGNKIGSCINDNVYQLPDGIELRGIIYNNKIGKNCSNIKIYCDNGTDNCENNIIGDGSYGIYLTEVSNSCFLGAVRSAEVEDKKGMFRFEGILLVQGQ